MSRTNFTQVMASLCANIALWQFPKSNPQIRTFLSAAPEMSFVSSLLISIDKTGNLCPYNDNYSLSLSLKYTWMELSKRATAYSLQLFKKRTFYMSSLSSIVFYLLSDNNFVDLLNPIPQKFSLNKCSLDLALKKMCMPTKFNYD